jgi:hypothetical protein
MPNKLLKPGTGDMKLCTIERRRIDPHKLNGVIVTESKALLLAHRVYDLQFDGYVAVRRRDITRLNSSDSDAYCERIMRKERLWKNPSKSALTLPIDDWSTLLKAIVGKIVIIENERNEDFFIGPVVACDDRFVSIHHFNGVGEWCDVVRVAFRSITAVTFGDRYSTLFSRSLPPRRET